MTRGVSSSRFINPRGARTELRYDAAGQARRVNDALGPRNVFAHDALGNVQSKLDALDRRTQYRYDAKGRLTGATALGVDHACAYDAEDNLTLHRRERRDHAAGVFRSRRNRAAHPARWPRVEYLYDTEGT